ncbi:MAG: TetR/AcrR family transcriptional regulator [Proteobacteria bacterium]|nr:TetR/AcrR family transcriptional regulator [Pseudomonadota bacterium]
MNINIVEKTKERYLAYERRHQGILDNAIRLFNEKGYKSTTTEEIARASGISKPTMSKHFETKKRLFLACFDSISAQLLDSYRRTYERNKDDEVAYFKELIEDYVDFVSNSPTKSMFLVHVLSNRDDPDFRKALNLFVTRCTDQVQETIASAKRKGLIKSQVDDRVHALMFVSHAYTMVSIKEFIDAEHFRPEILVQLMREGLF